MRYGSPENRFWPSCAARAKSNALAMRCASSSFRPLVFAMMSSASMIVFYPLLLVFLFRLLFCCPLLFFRFFFGKRIFPCGKVARGVARTAPERAPFFRPFLDDVAFVALRACHADGFSYRLGVFAFREIGTRQKPAESAGLDDNGAAAFFADLVGFFFRGFVLRDVFVFFGQVFVEGAVEITDHFPPVHVSFG